MEQQALKFKMENSLTRAKSEPNSAGIRGIFKKLQSGFEPIVFSWTSAFFLVFMPRWTWWCHNGFFSTQVHFLEATSWSSLWSRTTNAQGENSLHCSALHGGKSNPNPKFLCTAEAYLVCHISTSFQISLIYAFIGCP